MLNIQVINGIIQVGDTVAYPGDHGQVVGEVVKITLSSKQAWNGVETGLRVYVKRSTDKSTYTKPVIIRNPARLVKVIYT